jgi:hypothetical protein
VVYFSFNDETFNALSDRHTPNLDDSGKTGDDGPVSLWGRTGFDQVNTPEAACRGRCVGLVNHSHQNKTANQELALAA